MMTFASAYCSKLGEVEGAVSRLCLRFVLKISDQKICRLLVVQAAIGRGMCVHAAFWMCVAYVRFENGMLVPHDC